MSLTPKRAEQIDLWLTPEHRRTVERAAAYEGKAVSRYIIDAALGEAEAIIASREANELDAGKRP